MEAYMPQSLLLSATVVVLQGMGGGAVVPPPGSPEAAGEGWGVRRSTRTGSTGMLEGLVMRG
jgi:hypothetical protein